MSSLFVYGTLKSTGPNNEYLRSLGARLVTAHAFVENMGLLNLKNFPIGVHSDPQIENFKTGIIGELWELPSSQLNTLVRAENSLGFSGLYTRIATFVTRRDMLSYSPRASYRPPEQFVTGYTSCMRMLHSGTQIHLPTVSLGCIEDLGERTAASEEYQQLALVEWNRTEGQHQGRTTVHVLESNPPEEEEDEDSGYNEEDEDS